MKERVAVSGSLIVVVVAVASLIPSRAQEASSDNTPPTKNWAAGNPLRIAQLRWYQANLVQNSFVVGKTQNSFPYGLAFDGANIWTANTEGTVTKLRASDGANLGTFTLGGAPIGIAFDGANMWVTNWSTGGSITKLRASDGKILGTFPLGSYPGWMAFDGENIWVVNGTAVSKLRASDGKNLGTFNIPGGGFAVAFDGTYIWVTSGHNVVTRFRQDGSDAGQSPVGRTPCGIAFDGANIWVANNADGTITKLRASDGKTLGTFGDISGSPYGIAFDGANICETRGQTGRFPVSGNQVNVPSVPGLYVRPGFVS
jgi:hypothetical protein